MTVKITVEMEIDDKKGKEILPIIGKEWWERSYAENSAINRFENIIDEKLKNEEHKVETIEVWNDDEWEWEILIDNYPY